MWLFSGLAQAQNHHWFFMPEIIFDGNASSNAFRQTTSTDISTYTPASLSNWRKSMIISTSDEDMFFLAHKEGQFDKDGAWISSDDLLQHQYVSFTMPEACNRVFFIGWEDQFTPVRASYLRLNTYDIAENDEGKEYLSHVATEVITYIQTPCETTMDEGYATALAVSPLREDGSRQVFIISGAVWGGGSDVRQIIVHADGTYSDIEPIGTLPFVVHGSKLMEFTPDGTKVLVKDCERSVFHVIEVSSLDVTSLYLDPEEEVSGFEYIPKEKLGSTYDRIYFSYHHHGNLSEGGIRYVDDMGGVLGAMQQVFTSASPAAFGYTEIEYARDGKIYFAYKPDYNSSLDINVAGTLYAFDPTLAATNAPVQASASGISEIPVYSRLHNHYFIQSQIDGDAQDFMPYGVTFTLNGEGQPGVPPKIYVCDAVGLTLSGVFSGSVNNYTVTLDTGIISGSGPYIFTPVGTQPSPVNINDATLSFSLNFLALFPWLNTYNGDIRITVTANGCKGNISKSLLFELNVPTIGFRLTTSANPCNNGSNDIVQTLPIPNQIFTDRPCEPGWVGAASAGITNPNFTGAGTITNVTHTIYEVHPYTGAHISTIGSVSSTVMPNSSVPFFTIVNGYFIDNYLSGILSDKTFKYNIELSVDDCIYENYSYFRIAHDSSISYDSRFWRMGGEDNNEISSASNSFSIYPNPAIDNINIKYDDMSDGTILIITDNLGKVIKRIFDVYKYKNLSVQELPSGKYFMILLDKDIKKVATFIKQ